jgi:hypothetical protein
MRSISTLNTRETALVAWLTIGLLALLFRADVREGIAAILKNVLGSRILAGLLLGGIAYTTVAVLLLRGIGLWNVGLTKTTVLWFVGTGLARTYSLERKDAAYFKRLVLGTVAFPVVVEFLANLHTFRLLVEFPLVFVVFVLALLQVVPANDPSTRLVVKGCGFALGVIGFVVLAFSISDVVRDFDHVVTAERGREFLQPVLLTACFLPFLYVVALYGAYQTTLHMVRVGVRGDHPERLYRFARRSIIRACGPYPARAQLFEEDFRGRLWGASREADIASVVDAFRQDPRVAS